MDSDKSFIELQTRYMEELREQVQDLESLFLLWEKDQQREHVDKAMGILHSIKGTSGSYLLNELSSFTHLFEDFIVDPRMYKESKFSDTLFKLIDSVTEYINDFPDSSGKDLLDSFDQILTSNEMKQLKSCLILEMSRSMVKVYTDVIKNYGFSVSSVNDAFTGLKRLSLEDFDLLVLSTNLNGFDGVALYNCLLQIIPDKIKKQNILLITTDAKKVKKMQGFTGDVVLKSNTLVDDLESWLDKNYGAPVIDIGQQKSASEKDLGVSAYKNIYFIDDSEAILGLASHIFKKQSPESNVKYFSDPQKALSEMGVDTPDLIICDYQMEKLNGGDLKKEINKQVNLEKVPFLFLTGEKDESLLKQLKALGALGTIQKPFNHQTLLTEISEAVKAA
jgi:DNA-binding response OmpR family regulator/HPt (histidine-containing phosphotransfer) domain-containing protein